MQAVAVRPQPQHLDLMSKLDWLTFHLSLLCCMLAIFLGRTATVWRDSIHVTWVLSSRQKTDLASSVKIALALSAEYIKLPAMGGISLLSLQWFWSFQTCLFVAGIQHGSNLGVALHLCV